MTAEMLRKTQGLPDHAERSAERCLLVVSQLDTEANFSRVPNAHGGGGICLSSCVFGEASRSHCHHSGPGVLGGRSRPRPQDKGPAGLKQIFPRLGARVTS